MGPGRVPAAAHARLHGRMPLPSSLIEARLPGDGVTLRVHHGGDGPAVVLLHGFPDGPWVWDALAAALLADGWRVVVPTQRGYPGSDAPRGIAPYRRVHLAADVLAVLDALGIGRASVVGHDWGGGVAWEVGLRHPERLDRLVAVNCPEPGALRDVLLRSAAQRRRSAYMAYFQLPRLPERKLAAVGVAKVRRRAGATDVHDADVAAAFRTPEDLRGPISWYRAAARDALRERPRDKVPVPTTIVWGTDDTALGEELIAPSLARCEDGRVVRVPGGGHWPMERAPVAFQAAMREALAR